jgi:hypothetical protein
LGSAALAAGSSVSLGSCSFTAAGWAAVVAVALTLVLAAGLASGAGGVSVVGLTSFSDMICLCVHFSVDFNGVGFKGETRHGPRARLGHGHETVIVEHPCRWTVKTSGPMLVRASHHRAPAIWF